MHSYLRDRNTHIFELEYRDFALDDDKKNKLLIHANLKGILGDIKINVLHLKLKAKNLNLNSNP